MLGAKNIDVLGHLGGWMTGAILGHWIMPCLETDNAKKARATKIAYWSKIGTVVWFSMMLIFFYTLREPVNKFATASTEALTTSEVDAVLDTDAVQGETLSQTNSEADARLEEWLGETYGHW